MSLLFFIVEATFFKSIQAGVTCLNGEICICACVVIANE